MKRIFSGRKRIAWLVLAVAAIGVWIFATPAEEKPPVRYSDRTMQAIVHDEYGPPDVLRLEQVRVPLPAEHQVLVEIVAAAANPLDWHYLRGTPYLMRLDTGFRRPKDHTVGVDMAGRVVAVGSQVTRFKVGDEVFGTAAGAFADFALASERRIAPKPATLTFEQAAAVPVAAVTALQGLRDKGHVEPGDRVLINGASGGVGTFAVQIAKALGADVIAVCSGRNAALVRSLGADAVVDYTQQDFTAGQDKYDVVLDLVGNRDLGDVRRVLAPKGVYVLIGAGGPQDGRWIGPFGKVVQGLVLSTFGDQEYGMLLASVTPEDLAYLGELMTTRKVTPVIDRRYTSLAEVPDALAYLERGRARGKVIIAPDALVRP